MYRYVFHHPIIQAGWVVTVSVAALGGISALTHGIRYGGSIPIFFYVSWILVLFMAGFTVTKRDQLLIWQWYGITYLSRKAKDFYWSNEGKLWRLSIIQQEKAKLTTLLTRHHRELQP